MARNASNTAPAETTVPNGAAQATIQLASSVDTSNLKGVTLTGRAAMSKPVRGRAASGPSDREKALLATLVNPDAVFTNVHTVNPDAKVKTDATFTQAVYAIAKKHGCVARFSGAEKSVDGKGRTVITRQAYLEIKE